MLREAALSPAPVIARAGPVLHGSELFPAEVIDPQHHPAINPVNKTTLRHPE
ncbi:hypothetical protein [Burkholderia gladioli]|uniref:hypothetical protein n=1 Tax=Burkholderia gladioli TaxID=28095 RepID=UPI0012D2DDED|nr:hypothetical protein [Burkholderia gladioli]